LAQKSSKKVLICPLDWGLGHAGRDVQIIDELLNAGFEVIIGADNAPLFFLCQYFPNLPFVKMPSFKIEYPAYGSMVLKMLVSMPKILFGIIKEHYQLKRIIKQNNIDIVISDNRYGLWNKKVHTIFISHQVFIKTPFKNLLLESLINRLNHWFIAKFNECWIPDFPGEFNLSGTLSHNAKLPLNAFFIGILSRFKLQNNNISKSFELSSKYDILLIISGPEPQRSIFEKNCVVQISISGYSALVVQGKPLEKSSEQIGKIRFVNHLNSRQLYQLIIETPIIISRSGYSTIMDLTVLGNSAILVPTPGQTEQEYLAKIMLEKKWFYTVSQAKFNLDEAIVSMKNYFPGKIPENSTLLKEKIKSLSLISQNNKANNIRIIL